MISYGEYLQLYVGQNPIPAEEFGFYAKKASALLDSYTFGRSRESKLEEVRCAEADIAQQLYEDRGRRGVRSESNDGLSVSYERGTDFCREAARQWLAGTGLLYAGVKR